MGQPYYRIFVDTEGVGHAFVGITDANGVTRYYGYWPRDGIAIESSGQKITTGPGEVRDETQTGRTPDGDPALHPYDYVTEPRPLTDQEYENITDYIETTTNNPGEYTLFDQNCAQFAEDIATMAGDRWRISDVIAPLQLKNQLSVADWFRRQMESAQERCGTPLRIGSGGRYHLAPARPPRHRPRRRRHRDRRHRHQPHPLRPQRRRHPHRHRLAQGRRRLARARPQRQRHHRLRPRTVRRRHPDLGHPLLGTACTPAPASKRSARSTPTPTAASTPPTPPSPKCACGRTSTRTASARAMSSSRWPTRAPEHLAQRRGRHHQPGQRQQRHRHRHRHAHQRQHHRGRC